MQIVLVSSFFPWQSFKVQRCPIIPQRMEIPFFTVLILLWLVSNTCYDCRPLPLLFVQKQCLQCMLKRCAVPVLLMVGSSLVVLPHLLLFKSISKSISNLLQKKQKNMTLHYILRNMRVVTHPCWCHHYCKPA